MVVDPTNSTHTLSVVPRFYPNLDITVSLYNEATQETDTPTNTYNIDNGKLLITFDYTFVNRETFQLKVAEGENVVYRGKIEVTDQDPQDFNLTKDVYYYS